MLFSEDVPKHIFFSICANEWDLKNKSIYRTIIGNNFWMTKRNIEENIYILANVAAIDCLNLLQNTKYSIGSLNILLASAARASSETS